MADPGRRLGARVIDGLLFLPVAIACIVVALALVAPHVGRILPPQNSDPNSTGPTPGILWLYLAAFAGAFVGAALFVVYETVATARYGRTFGKRWMKIRPLTVDGHALGWGRALGRSAIQSLAGFLSWIGLLDPLWCLWDPDRQCLHDKIAGTLVVND